MECPVRELNLRGVVCLLQPETGVNHATMLIKPPDGNQEQFKWDLMFLSYCQYRP